METFYKINKYKRLEKSMDINYLTHLKNKNLIKVDKFESKQNESKPIEIAQNTNIDKLKSEKLIRTIKFNKLIINTAIQPKNYKKTPNNKRYLITNSYFQNRFKTFHNFLRLLISFINLTSIFVTLKQEKIKFKYTEVILKVKETKNIYILSKSFFTNYQPYEIYINDNPQPIPNNYLISDLNNLDIKDINNLNDPEIIDSENINENVSVSDQNYDDIDDNNIFDEELQIEDSEIINSDENDYNDNENQKNEFDEPGINTIRIIWNYTITSTKSMFAKCDKIIYIDLSNFNTTQVKNMNKMFYGCSSLKSLNFDNFDTSNVTKMENMFSGCLSLISLNLSNFDTRNVVSMQGLFYRCELLNSLNLNKFNTIHVSIMTSMFNGCIGLKTLTLTNFDTSQVERMNGMFCNCTSLKKLYISNFNTTKVKLMQYMFYRCLKLVSVDISKFNTSQVSNMGYMFRSCLKLNSLYLSNFDTSKVTNMGYMFFNCQLLTSLDISNFNTNLVQTMRFMFFTCKKLTTLNLSNFSTSKVINMTCIFYKCSGLNSIDLSNFETSNVVNMAYMFYGCKNVNSLNLHNFDTSKVTRMDFMFNGCSNIVSLDLSKFNATLINNIAEMFHGCSKLISLDLSHFIAPQLKDMSNLFSGCSNLIYLNLSNFDTSQVKNFSNMFSGCTSLSILDISKFKTSLCVDMSNMFSGCKKILSLDLTNFNTSKVTDMNSMFSGCTSLISLDLSNLISPRVNDMNHMFYGCSLLKSLDFSNFIISEVKDMSYMFYGCSNLESLHISELNTSKTKNMSNMFSGCSSLITLDLSNFITSKVVDMSNMFYNCSNLEYITFRSFDIEQSAKKDNIFFQTYQNLMVCTENNNDKLISLLGEKVIIYCNDNSSNKYNCYMKNLALGNNYICGLCQNNYTFNYNESINKFYYSYLGYYINCSAPKFILCYDSCEICEIETNETNETNKNCTECKNDFFYKFNIAKNMYKTCYPIEIKNKTEKMQNIINNLIDDLNLTDLESGKDKKIVEDEKVIIFTSTENQKNNEEKNISMNLGNCENILKNHYNISNNTSLFILQVITEENGMKIPKLDYEVYYPLDNSNKLTKLNLSLCKNTKIEISISVKINDSLDKYDPNSDYYNDICSKTTSESGTDISLKDRKNEFVNNNMSLCEENCELIGYDQVKNKAKCSCNIKLNMPSDYNSKFNKNDFFKSFIDINNIFNFNIMKCYQRVLEIKSLNKNYGFFIVCPVIILYFIVLFTFIISSFDNLKKEIYYIIFASKNKGNPIKKNKHKIKEMKRKKFYDNSDFENSNNKAIKPLNKLFYLNKKKKVKKEKNFSLHITQNIIYNSNKKLQAKKNKIIEKNNIYINKILMIKEFELNSLNYENAIRLDHRKYCQYYCSLIKYNHPFLFSFGSYNDYNSKIIKIFLFFFSFCLDFGINALFFNDDTMHKIYEDKGDFNFLYQLPQILYSTLISRFIDTFIRSFALTQDNIVELKRKIIRKEKIKYTKFFQILKIKFILFFISTFIVLLFLGYYITCFCGIYINTQIHLIKDCIISLVTSLLIPFVFCIIPGIFRIPSLRVKKRKRKLLYKISSFLENWLS